MKVYLAYVNCGLKGHDEKVVKEVFDSKQKALDYIIKKYYSGPFPEVWLERNNDRCYVEEMEVK